MVIVEFGAVARTATVLISTLRGDFTVINVGIAANAFLPARDALKASVWAFSPYSRDHIGSQRVTAESILGGIWRWNTGCLTGDSG